MCGIAGVFMFGDETPSLKQLNSMSEAMYYRGPEMDMYSWYSTAKSTIGGNCAASWKRSVATLSANQIPKSFFGVTRFGVRK